MVDGILRSEGLHPVQAFTSDAAPDKLGLNQNDVENFVYCDEPQVNSP